MSAATGTSRTHPVRGRIDKQRAVLTAAFTVFTRVGYAQARVDEIAAEAGVAKATVYNHFGDKQTLFREAVRALSDSALAANLAAVERLSDAHSDIAETLRDVGSHLAACYCAEDSRALRRLVAAEAAQFPDLLELLDEVAARVTRALADRLARLALSGALRIDDPDLAAAQFAALLTGPVDARSRFGTRPVPASERDPVTAAAVTTFLAAYGR
ncbi:AcrR family transcriptional regulator [Nocardia transvalensis]|uniref:AcrR family transcriptional regulator n=1 Tax=Nocardia transvalensis TaxID=37333 RepID=A0A7W9UML3_9NOCA|nr:TetR/AcrR family transcriptional regulator [Nocardia transvalensis]MBB5918482.1 AcrR family transcriptional regulator [Nocardia transvalensis]